MNIKNVLVFGFCMIVLAGAYIVSGCCSKTVAEGDQGVGPAEKAGAAVDKAV